MSNPLPKTELNALTTTHSQDLECEPNAEHNILPRVLTKADSLIDKMVQEINSALRNGRPEWF